MEPPVVIDLDHHSILLGWIAFPNCLQYELQMCGDPIVEENWTSLSTKIKSTSIRKKNLTSSATLFFRVRPLINTGWELFSGSSEPIVIPDTDALIMNPPSLSTSDSGSLTIQWENVPDTTGYSIRYREDNINEWNYIATVIHGNVVRKKNLHCDVGYIFSVKPVGNSDSWIYSVSSPSFFLPKLSPFLMNLLPLELLRQHDIIETKNALCNKVTAVYFSAHWCGPCRNFTPMLSQLYSQCKASNKAFEVIFCSADHSEKEFQEYYNGMPWLAINYTDDKREELMSKFQVNGIPKLSILAPAGNIIVDNAAGGGLSMASVDQWIQQAGLK